MAKDFSFLNLFDDLMDGEDYFTKRMFSGLAIYSQGKQVAVLMENPGEKTYKGKNFKLEPWNGILWPTNHEYQNSLIKEFPSLVQHPVLKKWLYLPATSPDFEDTAIEIIEAIKKQDRRLGIYPKLKRY